jgi:hypothetical protein
MLFSQEIINVLDYLCHKFGIAIDWTSENIMPLLEDLCGRYIQYEVYTSIAWCVVFAAIVVAAGLIWGIAEIVNKHSTYVSNIPEVFKSIFFAALAIGVIVWTCQAFDIIECYTIPEKTILEYLKHLMNTTSSR